MTLPFFAQTSQVIPDEGSSQIVTLCGWCPDKAVRDAEALAANPGATLSHTICPSCRDRIECEERAKQHLQDAYAGGRVTVESHPQGGYTHGIPAGGHCRVFAGWWPTRRQATEALK